MKIYTDGASRNNGTPYQQAGAGAVLYGEQVHQVSEYLGSVTNNCAEYYSLILALNEAIKLKEKSIEIYMDSLLVCNQVKGSWRVKNRKLQELHSKVISRLQNFDSWEINHIGRNCNKHADKLANDAIDDFLLIINKV